MSPSTLFDLASLTKPMTAIALARSDLPPTTPLHDLLIEARGTPTGGVPLELLLAHRAGLEANLPIFHTLRGNPDDAETKRAMFRWAAEARRLGCEGAPPEEGFLPLYSDLGYLLSGEAMARALGHRDAGGVVEDKIVRPLGLQRELGTVRDLARAGVDVEAHVAPTEVVDWRGGVVRGAVHDENAWMLTGHGASGHAGMFGTVSGVLAFGKWVLEVMPTFEWTWRPRPGGTLRAGFDGKSDEGSSAGSAMGPRAFGHLGFTGTSLWIEPDERIVVVMLTNRVFPSRDSLAIRAARPLSHDVLVRLARASGKGPRA